MEILIALLIGFGGGWWAHTPDKFDCRNDAQVVAACPPLTKLEDNTFGGHIYQMQVDSGQYRECRAACLPGAEKK